MKTSKRAILLTIHLVLSLTFGVNAKAEEPNPDCPKKKLQLYLPLSDLRKIAKKVETDRYANKKKRHLLHPSLDIEVEAEFKFNGFLRAQSELQSEDFPNSENYLAGRTGQLNSIDKADKKIINGILDMIDGSRDIVVIDDNGLSVSVDTNFENLLASISQKAEGLSVQSKLILLSEIGDLIEDGYDYDLPITPTSMDEVLQNSIAGDAKGGVCRDIHQFLNYVALAIGFKEVGLLTANWYSESQGNAGLHVYSYLKYGDDDNYVLLNYDKVIDTGEKVLPQAMEIADRWTGHSNDSVMVETTNKRGDKQLQMFIPSSSRWVLGGLHQLTCVGDIDAPNYQRCQNPKLAKASVRSNGSFNVSANLPLVTQYRPTKKGKADESGNRGAIHSTLGFGVAGMRFVGNDEDRLTPEGSEDVFATALVYGNSHRTFNLDSKGSTFRIGGGGHFGYSYKKTSMLGSELEAFEAGRHGVTLGLKANAGLHLTLLERDDLRLTSNTTYNFELDAANQHVGNNLPAGDFTLPYWRRHISSDLTLTKDSEEHHHAFTVKVDHIGHVQFKSGDLYDFTGGVKNKTVANQLSAIYHYDNGSTFGITAEGTVLWFGNMTRQDAVGLRARLRLEARDSENRITFYLIGETSAIFQNKEQDNSWFESEDNFLNIFVGTGARLTLRKEQIENLETAQGSLYIGIEGGVEKGFGHPDLYLSPSRVDANGAQEGYFRSSNGSAPIMGQSGVNVQGMITIGGSFGLSQTERQKLREKRRAKKRAKLQAEILQQYPVEIENEYKKAKEESKEYLTKPFEQLPAEVQEQLLQIKAYEEEARKSAKSR